MDAYAWNKYEWDERKRLANLDKHGIDFRDGVLLAASPLMVGKARTVAGEERWLATGQMNGLFVTMIFTRRDDTIRVISMRSARHDERKAYQALLGG